MKESKNDAFQAIADPNRRHILNLLIKENLTINSLAENFEMSRPAVSKHIKILQMAGFVSIEDKGRERYCMLRQEGFEGLKEWIAYFDQFWSNKIGNLERLLNERSKEK